MQKSDGHAGATDSNPHRKVFPVKPHLKGGQNPLQTTRRCGQLPGNEELRTSDRDAFCSTQIVQQGAWVKAQFLRQLLEVDAIQLMSDAAGSEDVVDG